MYGTCNKCRTTTGSRRSPCSATHLIMVLQAPHMIEWGKTSLRMGYAKVKDEQFRVIEDVVRSRDTFVSLPTGYGVLICYGYLFDELSVLEVRSKPLTIAPKRQRARNDVTADPHLRREASSSSESSDSDACKKKFKRRERTHHSRSRESSFLNAPFCLHYHVPTPRGTKSRGVSMPTLINLPLP